MSKYATDKIYEGDLVRYQNKEKEVLEKNLLLIYDEESDTFLKYLSVFNYLVDLDLNSSDLSLAQREEYHKIITANRLLYGTDLDNKVYIDEKTIQEASFYPRKGRGK